MSKGSAYVLFVVFGLLFVASFLYAIFTPILGYTYGNVDDFINSTNNSFTAHAQDQMETQRGVWTTWIMFFTFVIFMWAIIAVSKIEPNYR